MITFDEHGGTYGDVSPRRAVIHTLSQLHGLAPLTRRDDTATGIFSAMNLTPPPLAGPLADARPSYVPPNPEKSLLPHEGHAGRPLTPPAEVLLGMLLAKCEPEVPSPHTYGDADDALVRLGTGLFGTVDRPTS